MAIMKAYLKNYRQSPRKVRIVGDLVKGKGVEKALLQLNFLNKRASKTVMKLVNSAVANAKENNSANKEDLYIKSIRIDEGPTLKRIRPRAHGSAYVIRKRTSNISLELGKAPGKSQAPKSKSQTNSKSKITKRIKANKLKAKS